MTKNQALKILIDHNKWRRDQSEIPVPFPTTYTAKELGQAIDVAIRVLGVGARRWRKMRRSKE